MSGSYRVVDPLDRLKLRVRLRLLQDVRGADKDAADSCAGRVFTYELKWQEQRPGPRHALGEVALVPSKKKKKRKEADADVKGEISAHLKERQHRVFAYAAAEGFVLEEERSLPRRDGPGGAPGAHRVGRVAGAVAQRPEGRLRGVRRKEEDAGRGSEIRRRPWVLLLRHAGGGHRRRRL